jgi:hypothetical protein
MKKKPGLVNKEKISSRLFMSSLLIGIVFFDSTGGFYLTKEDLPKEGKNAAQVTERQGWVNLLNSRQNGILKINTGSLQIRSFMEIMGKETGASLQLY